MSDGDHATDKNYRENFFEIHRNRLPAGSGDFPSARVLSTFLSGDKIHDKRFRALRSMRTGRPRSQQHVELLAGQPLDRLERINLFNILVRTQTHDARKA